ncbi:MAG: hypothetical protein ACREP6_14665, partial [Candidatus Binataceae bacterium]
IYDSAAGAIFRTPSMLGAVIFGGTSAGISIPMVVGYTALHFIAFIAFGIAASILVYGSEREPLLALGVLVLFLWFEVCFFGFVTFLDVSAVGQLGWLKIIVGNLLALAGIIAYFQQRHPGIIPGIVTRWGELSAELPSEPRRRRPAHLRLL